MRFKLVYLLISFKLLKFKHCKSSNFTHTRNFIVVMSFSIFIFHLNSSTLYSVFFAVMSLLSVYRYIVMCSVPTYVAVLLAYETSVVIMLCIFGYFLMGYIFRMRNARKQFNNNLLIPIGMRYNIYPFICSIYIISIVPDNVNTSRFAGFIIQCKSGIVKTFIPFCHGWSLLFLKPSQKRFALFTDLQVAFHRGSALVKAYGRDASETIRNVR